MTKLALLTLLACAHLTWALPSPQAGGGVMCVENPKKYSENGLIRDVPPGTVCKITNGVFAPVIVSAGPLIAMQNPDATSDSTETSTQTLAATLIPSATTTVEVVCQPAAGATVALHTCYGTGPAAGPAGPAGPTSDVAGPSGSQTPAAGGASPISSDAPSGAPAGQSGTTTPASGALPGPSSDPPAGQLSQSPTATAGAAQTPPAGGTTDTKNPPQPGTGFVQDPDRPQLIHSVPLGISPSGAASCPSVGKNPVVTALAPKPVVPTNTAGKRFVAYWSVWAGSSKAVAGAASAQVLPSKGHLEGVTHLVLSFWDPNTLNSFAASSNNVWGETIAKDLRAVNSDMKVMVAVGGWALDEFFRFNATDLNRGHLADLFVKFVEAYDLDGIDVDWEYPVNNGATYKTTRTESPCDKANNVLLMQEVRLKLDALGQKTKKPYVLSLAVPAKQGDIDVAYDKSSATEINKAVDFWNLMSYDYTNRRSSKAEHHAGGWVIDKTIKSYEAIGVTKEKMNIGFPMYAKWFNLKTFATDCTAAKPINCNLGEGTFEGSQGEDKKASGTVLFNQALMDAAKDGTDDKIYQGLGVYEGWDRVKGAGVSDPTALATTAYDETSKTWYTWLTPTDTEKSCSLYLPKVGGVMAWSIFQDSKGAEGGEHFDKLQACVGAK